VVKDDKEQWFEAIIGKNLNGYQLIEQEYLGQRYRVRLLRPYSMVSVNYMHDESGNLIRVVMVRGYKYDDKTGSRVAPDGGLSYPDKMENIESMPQNTLAKKVAGDYIMFWFLPEQDGRLKSELDWSHPNLVIPAVLNF